MEWREFLEKKDDWDKQEKKLDSDGGWKNFNISDSIKEMKEAQAKLTHRKRRRENPKTWASEEEKDAGKRKPSIFEDANHMKTPLTRVSTHTTKPVTSGGVAVDTKVGRGSGRSDHQSKTGRNEQYITTENAEKWKSWLEKTEPTGLTARQKKLAKEIADGDNEDHKELWAKEASWEAWLEKDSLDGKQGHDPKKFEWNSHYTDNKEEITDMKPEDFQDLTVGQAGSDAHARHPKNMFPEKKNPKTNKYEKQKPKRDSFIDGKDDDDKRYPIDPKRSKDERPELFRERENRRQSSHRGDELGAVEGYKRQLRHGGKPEIPALGTRTDSQGRKHVTDHEGRHRAQAALEEGEKTIPVAVNHNRGSMALGREKRLNQKEIDEMGGEQGEPTSPRHNRDRISSGINSMHYHNQPKDKKIQQGMEALKSWEAWLEKTMTYRKTRGNVEMKYPTEGEEVWDSKQQKRVKEDKTPKRTNKLTSWESFLEKNNAIETSHKDEKEKVEWDGKFNSSTIRDDVKDEKSNSEEESLEELTDGDLVEIEKLKSEVDKIITDLTRNIKDPKRREDIVQRQADQKVKETVTKAWELFLVNKPMNQFDKQPQKKPDEKGLKPAPLTETVPILNPKGSIDPNKKTVSRLNHETGLRESVFIKGKPSTNPETDIGGGRPEEPNVVGDLKHGSVNSSDGRARGHTITDN
ncbi:MAG: hypothetical protein ABGX42_02715, partial [Gammaproteobacteria bacterium]